MSTRARKPRYVQWCVPLPCHEGFENIGSFLQGLLPVRGIALAGGVCGGGGGGAGGWVGLGVITYVHCATRLERKKKSLGSSRRS